MALVTGRIQQVKYNPAINTAFVWLGPTPSNTVIYYVITRTSDAEASTSVKSSLVDALTTAMLGARTVTLTVDSTSSSEISAATI